MRYIKKFETLNAFNDFVLDENNTPNVSLIEELLGISGNIIYTGLIHNYTHNYTNDYFTLVAIDDCYFSFSANAYEEGAGLSYSLDNGETWSEYIDYAYAIHITPGNKVLFKGRNVEFGGSCGSETTFNMASSDENNNYIETPQRFNVEGNITSLVYGDNFNGQTIIGEDDYFKALFEDNKNLVSAENLILPTNTTPGCYSNMFYGCTSLTTAPVLPATILADYCYENMFGGCTSLNSIICLATSMSVDYYPTGYWVSGCGSTGTFKLATTSIWEISENGIPDGWNVEYYDISQISGYAANYFTLVAIDNCDFEFDSQHGYLSYSLDNGVTWSELYQSRKENNKISVTAGNKILFKGNNNGDFVDVSGGLPLFHSNGRYNVEGNIMSLIYGDDFVRHLSLNKQYTFAALFVGETNLISAANLILPEILSINCYFNMFSECTSLTMAPILRALYLTEGCYSGMFYNCILLNSITCLATNISAERCTAGWLYGVAQTGTFTKASDMTDWTEGTDGIPSGWTIQNAE